MRKLLLPAIFCLIYQLGNAQDQGATQDDVKTIEFDFSDPNHPPVDNVGSIKKGDFYRVIVKGINLNVYKIGVSAQDTMLSKPQQTPAFGNFQLDALSKLVSGISPLSTLTTVGQPMIQDIAKSVGLLKTSTSFTAITKSIPVNTSIIARMQQEKADLEASKGRIETAGTRIDNLKMDVYKLRLAAGRTVPNHGVFDFDAALVEIESIRQLLTDEKTNMGSAQKSYEAFSTANKVAIEAATDLKDNDKSIKDVYGKLIALLVEAVASVSADKSVELLSPLVVIQNNKDAVYSSMPQQYTGEQSKVILTIVPRDEKYGVNSYSTQFIFPLQIKRYTSVGISFYGSSLYDKAYSTVKTKLTDSTATYGITAENNGKVEMGIAALLRYGKKIEKIQSVGIHGSLGAGISVSNKVKPRMLFGGGVSYGDRHMLSIDAGGILGYVDRLSNTISERGIYPEKPESLVVSKVGAGVFLSIGYIYQF